MKDRINILRLLGFIEGVSFLILLLIAMPMKYGLGISAAVTIVGWVHGVLFLLYILAVLFATDAMKWNWFGVLVALGSSLIPAGTFVLDRSLKSRIRDLEADPQKF